MKPRPGEVVLATVGPRTHVAEVLHVWKYGADVMLMEGPSDPLGSFYVRFADLAPMPAEQPSDRERRAHREAAA